MRSPMVSSFSSWQSFKNCRKQFQWRYMEGLVPIEKDRALTLGTLIHKCLELWHRHRDLPRVFDHIDRTHVNRAQNENERRDWHLARAMMTGYAARYAVEEFEVIHLEKEFRGPITNPVTDRSSRSFALTGRVDGIVRMGSETLILENKTTSQLGGDYLERLWSDFQVTLYTDYVDKALGIKIDGILYNVLVKSRIRQNLGESEAEFEARRANLLAKSKSGRTSARRRPPESDEQFQERLAKVYSRPEIFHRERLYISRDQITGLRLELWELTQACLEAKKRGAFYQNTAFCFQRGRTCPYVPLCMSGGSFVVKENLYQVTRPNEERLNGANPEARSTTPP